MAVCARPSVTALGQAQGSRGASPRCAPRLKATGLHAASFVAAALRAPSYSSLTSVRPGLDPGSGPSTSGRGFVCCAGPGGSWRPRQLLGRRFPASAVGSNAEAQLSPNPAELVSLRGRTGQGGCVGLRLRGSLSEQLPSLPHTASAGEARSGPPEQPPRPGPP
jgi:hypothetical protein